MNQSMKTREFIEYLRGNVSIVVCWLCGLLTPGVFIIFLFNREFFLQLDVIKLVLLALAICTPSYFVSRYISFFALLNKFIKNHSDPENDTILCKTVSSVYVQEIEWINESAFLYNGEILGVAVLLKIFVPKINSRVFVIIVCVLFLVIIVKEGFSVSKRLGKEINKTKS